MVAAAGHQAVAPTKDELDLFDPDAVTRAMRGVEAVVHLATRILPLDQVAHPEVWHENDRLRIEASRILVDAALRVGAAVYVQPTVTFVYPATWSGGRGLAHVGGGPCARRSSPRRRRSGSHAFGGRGVVLRLGLLDGPGTGNDAPNTTFGATLHTADAGRALLAALTLASGTYNVCPRRRASVRPALLRRCRLASARVAAPAHSPTVSTCPPRPRTRANPTNTRREP